MATFTNGFDTYQSFYYSGPSSFLAVIQVYQAGVFGGRIGFYPDGGPVIPNTTIAPFGVQVPAINYPISRFNDVILTLRYEKPLYVFFDNGSLIGYLGTSQNEPVGEQEGV